MWFAICSNLVVLPWPVCWQLLPQCIDKTGDGSTPALITGGGVQNLIVFFLVGAVWGVVDVFHISL